MRQRKKKKTFESGLECKSRKGDCVDNSWEILAVTGVECLCFSDKGYQVMFVLSCVDCLSGRKMLIVLEWSGEN